MLFLQPKTDLNIKTNTPQDLKKNYKYGDYKKPKDVKFKPIKKPKVNNLPKPTVNEADQQEQTYNRHLDQIENVESENKINTPKKPVYSPAKIAPEIDIDNYSIPSIKTNEIIVDYSEDYIADQILVLVKRVNYSPEVIEKLQSDLDLKEIGSHPLSSIKASLVVFKVLNDQDLQSLIINVVSNYKVLHAQPNYYYHTLGNKTLQYGVHKINADVAHKFTTGKGIKVAVIDTGIDYNHEVLKNKIVIKKDFVDSKQKDFTKDAHETVQNYAHRLSSEN